MDQRLLKAAVSGDSTSMRAMASQDRSILLGTTPQGNTCLHISATHGHDGFCMDVVALEESLLTTENLDGETPLLAAAGSGRASVASVLLRCYQARQLSTAILGQDKDGCNALHHAIHYGHRELALELIEAEPALSKHVNKHGESPMFIAALRNFTHVFEKLLNIPESNHAGQDGENALHAVVKNGGEDSAAKIMGIRPEMARGADNSGTTPVRLAVLFNKTKVLRVFLEHDCSLGYEVHRNGSPLLESAAYRGHIDAAREILKHCPDAPYRSTSDGDGHTWLQTAVFSDHAECVEFILKTPQLSKLVNMQDYIDGKTALHYAVRKCNPRIVAALLSHEGIDATKLDNNASPAAWELSGTVDKAKTLNWNEVAMMLSKADPYPIHNLHDNAKRQTTDASRKDAKSLTQTYTTNTSLVAILVTTVTFAAAFTLPGGYSSAEGMEGLPIMSEKVAFKAFLISDTLAMCSSFVVAFICIIARWEDYEFLIHYRYFTKKLMWFAYVATTTAFSTGLYTVLAPRLQWLAITICVMVALLPILTKLLGEWPVLKLRFRLGKTFNSDLLDMV